MRTLAVLAALVLLCAGCGGSRSSFHSASELAHAIGCAGSYAHTDDSVAKEFTGDSGDCNFAGDQLSLAWFTSSERLHYYRDVEGDIERNAVYGEDWAVVCGNEETCARVRDKIGGHDG